MREDMAQLSELGKIVDTENMAFPELMVLLVGFTDRVLLSRQVLESLPVSPSVQSNCQQFIEQAKRYLAGAMSVEDLATWRVAAWDLHDASPAASKDKALARTVVSTLYDEASAEFDVYGAEPMLETFFSCLLDLHDGYCRKFVDYVRSVAV